MVTGLEMFLNTIALSSKKISRAGKDIAKLNDLITLELKIKPHVNLRSMTEFTYDIDKLVLAYCCECTKALRTLHTNVNDFAR